MAGMSQLILSASAACLPAGAAPAFARSSPPASPAAPDKSSPNTVTEVVVTGVRQSVAQ